jgi:hypothetical protein
MLVQAVSESCGAGSKCGGSAILGEHWAFRRGRRRARTGGGGGGGGTRRGFGEEGLKVGRQVNVMSMWLLPETALAEVHARRPGPPEPLLHL